MWVCVSDRYTREEEQYATVEEFLTMCRECFGREPVLTLGTLRDGTVVYRDESEEVVLRELPRRH